MHSLPDYLCSFKQKIVPFLFFIFLFVEKPSINELLRVGTKENESHKIFLWNTLFDIFEIFRIWLLALKIFFFSSLRIWWWQGWQDLLDICYCLWFFGVFGWREIQVSFSVKFVLSSNLRENITCSLCNGFLLEGHIKVIEIMISRGIGTLYYIINFYLFSLLRGLLVRFYCNFFLFLISFN